MSARISKMYKLSGGTVMNHKCSECASYTESKAEFGTFVCERHGEESSMWNPIWTACKYFSAKSDNEKAVQEPEFHEEQTGQMSFSFSQK